MSNLLFEYLNEEVKLSKKIINIEKDFSNGYYFAELFQNIECLKSNIKEYKKEPKTSEEIKNNFNKLKPEFSNIGILIDDEIITLIINQQKNIAANLLYKIRNKMIRKKINFEEIINKMKISFKKLEQMKKNKEKILKTTQNFFKRKSNLFIKSKSTSNLSDFPLISKTNAPSLLILNKEEFKNNKTKDIKDITEEISQNSNYINNNKKTRNKKRGKLINTTSMQNLNNKNKTMKEFINFTSLENNTYKIGLNIYDIKPKLNKFVFSSNNNSLIKTDIFKEKLKEKLEEYKIEKKDRTTQKEKDLKHALKNSNLKNIQKPIDITSQKQFYKMIQYEKFRKKKFPIRTKKQIEEIKKNKIFRSTFNTFNIINDTNEITTNNNWYKTCYMNNIATLKKDLSLSPKEYIESLNRKEIIETRIRNELKRKRMKKDIFDIEDIVNLIIDITEEAFKYQNKTKEEFINLPEYKNWLELFIQGKSCIKNNDIINMNMNMLEKEEEEYIVSNKRKKINEENIIEIRKEKRRNEILNSEHCNNEYIDYINNRGYWNNELYIPKNYYGTQLHIYQVLGEDLLKTISSAKELFQGMIQINFNKMKNDDFELKEEEKDNITIPINNQMQRNELFGELIELNYDNNLEIKDDNNINNLNNKKLGYIPIKLCLIGTSYSGRRTQSELIHEKYPAIKIYSINDIINNYVKEYERLYININPITEKKEHKNAKKKKEKEKEKEKEELLEQERKSFEKIKELIEDYALKKEKDLSDEKKIKLLINEIEKDFPYKTEKEMKDNINKINQRKVEIKKEIEELNNEINKKNNKNKTKEEKIIKQFETELNELNTINYTGFILIDFPNNIQQHKILEENLSGFIQEIEKNPNRRDINLNSLTDDIDKPFNNISYINKDNKSAFDKYILLNTNEETIINHINIKIEEIKEQKDQKKKKEKKEEEWEEPDLEKLKEDLKNYNEEIPKIFDFLGNFKNLKIINEKDKNEINNIIQNELINTVKIFEDKVDNNNNINNNISLVNEKNQYFRRLKEIKIVIKKETSKHIIKTWKDSKNKYMWNTKEFIYNIYKLKEDVIKKMNSIQDDFIEFLNTKSDKKQIINLFLNKYNIFMQNFSSIKNNTFVKEELERDIIELTENLWKIIQLRKKKAIDELQNIKNKKFIKEKMENFSDMISNLFYSEAEYYLSKINIIQQYYNELENKPNKNVVEYKLKKLELMKNTNNLEIYIPYMPLVKIEKKEKIKPRLKKYEEEEKEYLISPKIDKIYKNCYKLLFNYDKKLKEEGLKENKKKEGIFSFKRKRTKKFEFKKDLFGFNDNKSNKIINSQFELKSSLNIEKIKYKLKLAFLKFYGEKFLEKLYNIEQITFENMDKWITKSVDAQNNAMNFIINKIKENILKQSFLEINDIILKKELDIFNIYEKVYHKFNEYNLKEYKLINDEDKKIDLNELYKIYLDLKSYEIQDNYVTLDSLIDILFKKYIFIHNSKGLMNCFKELPYKYLHKFILKFIIKTNKDQKLIRIDRLFSILSLMNQNIPDTDEITKMIKRAKNFIKCNNYISKDDFLKIKFWFDFPNNKKEKTKKELINYKLNQNKKVKKSCFNEDNKDNNKSSILIEESKNKRVSSPFQIDETPIKKNMSYGKNSFNHIYSEINLDNDNDTNKNNLKEILFLINKNYNDDINIFEFFDNISLKLSKKFKRKITLRIKSKSQSNINENDLKNNINQRHTYYENLFINSE